MAGFPWRTLPLIKCMILQSAWSGTHLQSHAAQVNQLPPHLGPEAAKAAARLTEALTQKLLALDAVQVDLAHRGARRAEIDRINRLCEQLEARRP